MLGVICSRSNNSPGDASSDVSCRATEQHNVFLRHARMENVLVKGVEIGSCGLGEKQASFGILVAGPIENPEVCIDSDDSHLRTNSLEVAVQRCSWLPDHIANLRVCSSNYGPLCFEGIALPQGGEVDRSLLLLQMGKEVLVKGFSGVSGSGGSESEGLLTSESHPRIQ